MTVGVAFVTVTAPTINMDEPWRIVTRDEADSLQGVRSWTYLDSILLFIIDIL